MQKYTKANRPLTFYPHAASNFWADKLLTAYQTGYTRWLKRTADHSVYDKRSQKRHKHRMLLEADDTSPQVLTSLGKSSYKSSLKLTLQNPWLKHARVHPNVSRKHKALPPLEKGAILQSAGSLTRPKPWSIWQSRMRAGSHESGGAREAWVAADEMSLSVGQIISPGQSYIKLEIDLSLKERKMF